jgi:hypothetical protein
VTQTSGYVPKKEHYIIDVDLDLVCSYCGRGRVFVTGTHDWRKPITAYCNNPLCGDPDDDDKGREQYIMVTQDGEFLGHGDPPVSNEKPEAPKASAALSAMKVAKK